MLNLSDCGLNDKSAELLAQFIQDCEKLKMLFISHNKIMGKGGSLIANAVASS